MDYFELERLMKSVASRHRIHMLYVIASNTDASVEEIAAECHLGYKSAAAHLKVLSDAGLIQKRQYGKRVEHELTAKGVELKSLLGQVL